MGKNAAQLNQKQVDVLEWIANECPEDMYQERYEHRVIARALERRALVTIAGRGASWCAKVTDTGRAWLARRPLAVVPPTSEADQLVDRVREAGGRLRLPVGRKADETYERLVRMSLRSPNRPRGKRL